MSIEGTVATVYTFWNTLHTLIDEKILLSLMNCDKPVNYNDKPVIYDN